MCFIPELPATFVICIDRIYKFWSLEQWELTRSQLPPKT